MYVSDMLSENICKVNKGYKRSVISNKLFDDPFFPD